jgi:hypothetical protein
LPSSSYRLKQLNERWRQIFPQKFWYWFWPLSWVTSISCRASSEEKTSYFVPNWWFTSVNAKRLAAWWE